MDNVERMEEFIREYYYSDLIKASKDDRSLTVDFSILDRFDPIISDQLFEAPDDILKALDEAAERTINEKIHVRIRNLPESKLIRIRNLRAKHLGKFLTIDTIIKAASEVKPQIYEVVFECPECTAKIHVMQESNIIQKPMQCDCGRRGDFKLLEKKMHDVRWLVAVEPFELTSGEQPGEISVQLKEDLTSPRMQKKTDPGSKLKITGTLKELPKRIKGKLSTKMDMYIEANHIESSDIEYEELEILMADEKIIRGMANDPEIYKKLVSSIAPGIYGFEDIKESIMLQLFGGVPHVLPDGSRTRGNIHILLTGDPGVGKTVLLKLVSSLVPRGRYVSGSGVSGAGLTATVVKNEAMGGWVLEAGALILCNKGLIAIDEFDKMNRDDQIAMHEATSVETVSIAKASIVATLPAQTAVLAGANPKLGRFDAYIPIAEQIDIPETLLSRFDLKFALRDIPDKIKDERIASHIVTSRTLPDSIEPPVPTHMLKKYIAFSNKIVKDIELLPEAADTIKNFYIQIRSQTPSEGVQSVGITLRQYEAMIRLAEASAKIRLDEKVRKEDADRAIRLMKASMQQLGLDFETGKFDIDKMESGVTSTKRRKIFIVLEIIERLQKELGKEIPIDDLKAEAENQGIEDIDDIIDRLTREGTIFMPRPGYVRKV
ncbi:minichromosome maintenance protein MCM [archaeon]|nr:minichromosome maintenance protein MCM [archaeon]